MRTTSTAGRTPTATSGGGRSGSGSGPRWVGTCSPTSTTTGAGTPSATRTASGSCSPEVPLRALGPPSRRHFRLDLGDGVAELGGLLELQVHRRRLHLGRQLRHEVALLVV